MERIAISKFKARCLAILDRVCRTGEPVLVTRFGKPVAEITPPTEREVDPTWHGRYRDRLSIEGDIVEPASSSADWEALDP